MGRISQPKGPLDSVNAELQTMAAELTSQAECIIHDEGDAMVVCHLRELGEGRNVVLRVTYALHIYGLRPVVDGRGKCFGIVARYELDSYVEALEVYW